MGQQQGGEPSEQAQGPSDALGCAARLQNKVRGNHKQQNAERRGTGGQYPQQEEKGCPRTRRGSFLYQAEKKVCANREAGVQQKEASQRDRCSQGEVHGYSSSREWFRSCSLRRFSRTSRSISSNSLRPFSLTPPTTPYPSPP